MEIRSTRTLHNNTLGIFDPHPQISSDLGKRRARSLGILSLTGALLALVAGGVWLALAGDLNPLLAAALVLGVAYGFSRSPQPAIGSIVATYGTAILILGFLVLNPSLFGQGAVFLLFPVLVSTLTQGSRSTAILTGICLTLLAGLPFILPMVEIQQVLPFVGMTFLIAVLSTGAAVVRDNELNQAQKQAADLAAYSQSLEKEVDQRTRNILITAEIGRAITATRELDVLLEQVVNLIVENFDFYHAQVFLVDESGGYAVLMKSTGVAGQELLERRHRLAVGSRSVIGRCTETGSPVVINDTEADPTHRRNELLPHTRAEMALPLRAAGRIIGALDVQSVNQNAFAPGDIPVFQTMADQLAVAIERVRLFERTQRDLRDIEMLNRQLTGEAWNRYVGNRGTRAIGYQAGEQGLAPLLPDGISAEAPSESVLSVPLRVRGETIGMLDVAPRNGEVPDPETRQMLEAVAERVAQALDSTRLSEQARHQAEQEQILSQLSASLQSTTDLNVILRVAAQQASQALGTRRGFVHLVMEVGPEKP